MKNFIIIVNLLICVNLINCTKLNYPRVLLPIFDKLSINFTLEVVEKGCFKWISSRSDLISIRPIYTEGECSHQAIVSTISKEKQRNTAIVLAEDLNSNQVLRCDVILDIIDQLGVLTTTRELFLEEAPETFELWAQDGQGNAFTTLEGIEFNWQISSQNNRNIEKRERNSWQQVLKFLTFSESPFHAVPKSVEKFEQLGLKGYMVLLEGINTGSAKVSVSLPYTEYKHVPKIEVDIMVLANIILDPVDVFILVGDTIEFRILQLKQGKLHEIKSNSQYYLTIENTNLATINGNFVKGNALGKTIVVLRDRNVPPSDSLNSIGGGDQFPKETAPRSTLTICKADKMTINLLPHNNWITVQEEKHAIAIDLYTHDDQKITLGSNYNIKSEFNEQMFYPLSRTKNGSRIYGEAIEIGRSAVRGRFEALEAKADLLVYGKLNLIPPVVVLPFDPNNPKNRQNIGFLATGGDDTYVWSSLNKKTVTISQNGLAETFIDKLDTIQELYASKIDSELSRYGQIKVAMARNPKISKTADILFLPPRKLEIVKYNFETPLGKYVEIYIALFTIYKREYVPFTYCDNVYFDLKYSNDLFVIDDNIDFLSSDDSERKQHKNACRKIVLKAIGIGSTNLKVSYNFMERPLRDEVTLFVYEPLNILNPLKNEIILPIGSARHLIYNNGAQKVFNIEAELIKRIEYDRKIVRINSIDSSSTTTDKHIFNVLCRRIGDTEINFKIYNLLQAKNCIPNVVEYITKIHCVKPRFINLYTTEKLKDSCPMKLKNSLMHMKKNDNLEVVIEVLDSKQRQLMNITSLLIDVKFLFNTDDKTIDFDPNAIVYNRLSDHEIIAGVQIPTRDYIMTAALNVQANFKIKAIVTGYDLEVLNHFNIISEQPEFGIQKTLNDPLVKPIIENELDFLTVNSSLLAINKYTIFLAKNKPVYIKIAQGSGSYEIQYESDTIQVEFDDGDKQLKIIPLRKGQAKIILTDRCLMTEPIILYISIVSIGKIRVQIPDRVEKTKSIEAIVKLYDSSDNLLTIDSNRLEMYALHETIFNKNILNIKLADQNNLNDGEIRYNVIGLELGETKVVFNSGEGDEIKSSPPVSIQVFPPLKLYPKNSTVIIGASVQIYSHGGPHPDINIIYSVQNENIISMESAVARALKLGNTKIIGKCIGVNPSNGQQMIFSQDTVEIYVIPFGKIKIKTPLEGIKSGAIMPAAIWGVPDISPLILGTLPDLKVVWTTNQPDVISIIGIFSDSGIEYTDTDSISIRIKALNPGKANLQAVVSSTHGKHTFAVEINVFKMPELIAPKYIASNTILIPPKTNIILKANVNDMVYEVEDITNGIVHVTKNGRLRTNDAIGRDLIIGKSLDQTLSIPVEVKNIHYILATLHSSSAKLKQTESKLPCGMMFILKITLHDNLGNEFSHNFDSINTINYKLSQKDIADINFDDNFTIGLNVPRDASGMLAISLKDTSGVKYAEDFIKLSVGQSQHIFPKKIMFAVGDIICFDSPLTYSTNWISSDDNILTVDNILGVGRVISGGTTYGEPISIINGDPKFGHIRYDIEVRDADVIEFYKSHDIFNGENYHGYLVIRNHLQSDKFTNVIAKNSTKCLNLVNTISTQFFTCNLRINEMEHNELVKKLKTQPIFDKQNALYACELRLATTLNEFSNSIKNSEITIELEAQLLNGISDSISLKIVPAIKVTPHIISVQQLPEQIITVTGLDKILQKLEVSPSDSSYLEINLMNKLPGALQYKARLINNYPDHDELSINIYSPLTLQSIQIPIQTQVMIQKCSNQPFFNMPNAFWSIISNFGLIISALIVLAATIYVFIYCTPNRQSNPQDYLIECKLAVNDLKRKAKKCYAEQQLEYIKSKMAHKKGNLPITRIHLENSIRKKNQYIDYEKEIQRMELAIEQISKNLKNDSCKDIEELCKTTTIQTLDDRNYHISQNDVNLLLTQLINEINIENNRNANSQSQQLQQQPQQLHQQLQQQQQQQQQQQEQPIMNLSDNQASMEQNDLAARLSRLRRNL